jgi:hypothetical protein
MMVLLSLVAAIALISARSGADDPPKAEAKLENKLIGTWKLVSVLPHRIGH